MTLVKKSSNKRVVFIFDRVLHYQKELFTTLNARLEDVGIELHLLSGETPVGAKGRVGLKSKILKNEYKFRFKEWPVRSFTFRRHFGVTDQLNKLNPDVVVVQTHVGNISYWNLIRQKRKQGFKLVSWHCGYEYNASAIKDFILNNFIPGFDHHLAYHTNAAKYAIRYGAGHDQVTVIHNTINESKIELLPKDDARCLVWKKHPEVKGKRIMLYVGAVLDEKNLSVVLDSLDIVKREDLHFLVVGDGAYMPTLRRLCEKRSDVTLAGQVVDGVGPYFDAADFLVLPGTGGLAINEAMAHSLPVISAYADGSADDLVVDGETGFRIRGGTAAELAEKIVEMLSSPHRMEQMGNRARQLITGDFSFNRFIARIVDRLMDITELRLG